MKLTFFSSLIGFLMLLFSGVQAHAQKVVVKKFDNGKPEMINYYNGGKSPEHLSKQETYNIDGKLIVEKNFFERKLHGPYKEFKEFDGTLVKEMNYENGKLNGLQNIFFNSGKLKQELNYADGKLDGLQREYFFKQDSIMAEHSYSGGIFHGVQKRWDENGKEIYRYNFVAGKPEGLQRSWKGGEMQEEKWVQGELEVILDTWTAAQPKHKQVYSYKNEGDSLNLILGKKLENEYMFYESGDFSAMMLPGEPQRVRELFPGGKVKGEGAGTFAKKEGKWTFYHQGGAKAMEGEYKDGKKKGVFQAWDEKGRLSEEIVFGKGGEKKESWKVFSYHWNDQKAFEGALTSEGWKTGLWKFWLEDGSRKVEEEWGDPCSDDKARPVLLDYTEWTPAGKLLLKGNEREQIEYGYHENGAVKTLTTKLYSERDPCKDDQPERFVNGRFERKIKAAASYFKVIVDQVMHFSETGDSLMLERFDEKAKLDGDQEGWYANGNKKYVYHYLNGRLQGTAKEWYTNGSLKMDHKYASTVGGGSPKLTEGVYYNEKGKSYEYSAADGKSKKKAMLEIEVASHLTEFIKMHPNE